MPVREAVFPSGSERHAPYDRHTYSAAIRSRDGIGSGSADGLSKANSTGTSARRHHPQAIRLKTARIAKEPARIAGTLLVRFCILLVTAMTFNILSTTSSSEPN
jgi:hypothetical protein